MVNKDEHRLLSVPEAVMELRLSATTVRRLLREDTIPVVQVGGQGHAIRIRRSDLDRLFEAQPK
jgi:excisionase family DNA binding protein